MNWLTPTNVTPGTAGSWQTIDLSSYIPTGTTGVALHFFNDNNATEAFGARKTGSTDNRILAIPALGQLWAFAGVNASRQVDVYMATVTDFKCWLVSAFGSEAVFFDNGTNVGPPSAGSYVDIDISALTGANTAVMAIIEVYMPGGLDACALRCNGSTDARYVNSVDHWWSVVPVDANEIFEGKVYSVTQDMFLVGYITANVTTLVNATDLSLTITGSFEDLPALPAGATGAFLELAGGNDFIALRKNGSAENLNGRGCRHGWAAIECDTAQLIEGKIGSTVEDFWLCGYAVAAGGATYVEVAQSAYMGGHTAAAKSQPAYMGGHAGLAVAQATHVGGHATTTGSQPVYVAGLGSMAAGVPAYVAGSGSVAGVQPAHVTGLASTVVAQPAYTAGLGSASVSQPAYIGGHGSTTVAQPNYVAGLGSVAAVQPAYVAGTGGATYVEVAQSAYMGGHTAAAKSQPAYMGGHATAAGSQAVHVTGAGAATKSQPAYVAGSITGVVVVTVSQPATIAGHGRLWAVQQCYVASPIPVSCDLISGRIECSMDLAATRHPARGSLALFCEGG
jgi:hypothetical protein